MVVPDVVPLVEPIGVLAVVPLVVEPLVVPVVVCAWAAPVSRPRPRVIAAARSGNRMLVSI